MTDMHVSGTTPARSATEADEWRRGWRTVVYGSVGYGSGVMLFQQTGGLFMDPVERATGLSTTQVTIMPIVTLLYGLASPAVAWLVTGRGPRFAAVTGLAALAGLLTVLAAVPFHQATYYLVAALIGVFGSLTYLVPFTHAAAARFSRGVGKAMGVIGSGASWLPALATPLIAFVIAEYGWRAGYALIAGIMLFVALPSALAGLRPDPRDGSGAHAPDGAAKGRAARGSGGPRVAGSARYWIVVAPFALVAFMATGVLQSMQSMLLRDGRSLTVATTMTTLVLVGAVAGRILGGVLLDLFSRHAVAVAVFAVGTAGCLALANLERLPAPAIGAAALAIGVCVGCEGDFIGYFLLKEYGRGRFTHAFGVSQVVCTVGAATGPLAFSSLKDLTGSYVAAAYAGAGVVAVAALLVAAVRVAAAATEAPADA